MYLISRHKFDSDAFDGAAHSALDQTKEFLSTARKKALDVVSDLSKRLKNTYPKIVHQMPDARTLKQYADLKRYGDLKRYADTNKLHQLAHSADIRPRLYKMWDAAGNEISAGTVHFAKGLHSAKNLALKAGLVYLVVKAFSKHEKIADTHTAVKAHIEEKPVESVVIALGVGYLLSKLLR